jgi:hypothetical protein
MKGLFMVNKARFMVEHKAIGLIAAIVGDIAG